MASHGILKSLLKKLFEDFKSQDVDNSFLDVVFDIGGKKLHAHKNILAAVSKPFGVMFADRWTTKDESIELTSYSYDDYKELMTFIYSGVCELKDDSIFNLVDMAEFYDIADFKSFCDAYLAKRPFTVTNVFQYVELARRYSLVQLDEALKDYVSANFRTLLESEEFMKCYKATVESFIDYAGELGEGENEYCFSRVLEWAHKQAETKMNESNNESFDLQNGIKYELSGVLPRFSFSKMSLYFLHTTVAKQTHLFSGDELSKLLLGSRKIYDMSSCMRNKMFSNRHFQRVFGKCKKLTVTNPQNCTAIGVIPYDQEIFNVLSSTNRFSYLMCVSASDTWSVNQLRIPSTPSSLKKNDTIPFYLVIRSPYICLLPPSALLDADYLIAEMKTTSGFYFTGQCFLSVFANF